MQMRSSITSPVETITDSFQYNFPNDFFDGEMYMYIIIKMKF